MRSQIREKEGLRIADRNKWFEEGVKLDEEAKLRRQKLDAVKKKKLEDLRYVLLEKGSPGLEYVVFVISTNPLNLYIPRFCLIHSLSVI